VIGHLVKQAEAERRERLLRDLDYFMEDQLARIQDELYGRYEPLDEAHELRRAEMMPDDYSVETRR
jgi:hypothetical protein